MIQCHKKPLNESECLKIVSRADHLDRTQALVV